MRIVRSFYGQELVFLEKTVTVYLNYYLLTIFNSLLIQYFSDFHCLHYIFSFNFKDMHYKFCVSVRNNWDKHVTFCKRNKKYKRRHLIFRVFARSSCLPFNGIFPIISVVWISQLYLNNIFWNWRNHE